MWACKCPAPRPPTRDGGPGETQPTGGAAGGADGGAAGGPAGGADGGANGGADGAAAGGAADGAADGGADGGADRRDGASPGRVALALDAPIELCFKPQ